MMNSNENLLAALSVFEFSDAIVGPRGDVNHHIMSVDVLQGDDDYIANLHSRISGEEAITKKCSIETPNRLRSMGTIVITLWSEECYTWVKTIAFHKGCIYENTAILEEGVDLHEPEETQLSMF